MPSTTTCRECGRSFDLSRQNYHDGLCPDCVDEERTWPLCAACNEPVSPDEGESIGLTNRRGRHAGRTDYVAAHEGDCVEEVRSWQRPARP